MNSPSGCLIQPKIVAEMSPNVPIPEQPVTRALGEFSLALRRGVPSSASGVNSVPECCWQLHMVKSLYFVFRLHVHKGS